MNTSAIQAYEVIKKEELADIRSTGYLLRHKKTGARVMVLENEDENKVFNIAFRTPPSDSTGVAHILEHSVLCGSKHFPLKDPFVELAKGSLNTFLNAMTYPDKTMYPVASCNMQDFKNLMHVYLDAVFYPNIYQKDEIFRQEGWSYHLDEKDGELTYNGVVYNEMKGAFSSPDEILDRMAFSSLFPDTPYGCESGGDPACIPDLTYEQFLDFHRRYYHPSNSFIYLYGDMDMAECLNWMDEQYLRAYDELSIDSSIPYQKPFPAMQQIDMDYPVSENEPLEENAYLSYNFVTGDTLDVELGVAFRVLEYALLSAPGAPVRQKLLDEKLGKDIDGAYSDGILQPFFSIIAKGAKAENKERFLQTIRETLQKIAKEGIPKKALQAGINYYEFHFREADFGAFPKGLMYGIDVFDTWLYNGEDPFAYLKRLAIFENMKEKAKTDYFEQLIHRYLLDNPHASMIVLSPKRSLAVENEEKLKEKLSAYKAQLSDAQLEKLAADTRQLQEYQEEEESEEALHCIPRLKRTDIKPQGMQIVSEERMIGGTKVLYHNLDTNGIGYLTLLFDTRCVAAELLPYLGLLKSVLGYIDTEHYTYAELFNEINAETGGIYCGLQVFDDSEHPRSDYRAYFCVKAKALYPKMDFAFRMIAEILGSSKLTDEKRIREIVAEQKTRLQTALSDAGHSTAALRASSYFSPESWFQDQISGIAYYRMLEDLEAHFDEKKTELFAILQSLMGCLFSPERLLVNFTADEEGYAQLTGGVESLRPLLEKLDTGAPRQEQKPRLEKKNEAYKTAGQVQYVAKAGNYLDAGGSYTGAMRVLKTILGFDYLWMNIRVKGGAYGCMNSYKRNGDILLVTYRDPHLRESLEVFDGIPAYLRGFHADEDTMTKYIIGTISTMDIPLSPALIGAMSLNAVLSGISQADLQRERDEVLKAGEEDIRALADVLEGVLKQDYVCVIGSDAAIEKDKEIFDQVMYL